MTTPLDLDTEMSIRRAEITAGLDTALLVTLEDAKSRLRDVALVSALRAELEKLLLLNQRQLKGFTDRLATLAAGLADVKQQQASGDPSDWWKDGESLLGG